MSWINIWVHLVFSTKNRIPFLHTREIRYKVFRHIKENAEKKGICLDSVNGHKEHVHCLISLGKEQSISKISQLIKGESSYWINKNQIIKTKFIWQDDYWAAGVSKSHIKQVRKYIHLQEEHHKSHSFADEISNFIRKNGWVHLKSGAKAPIGTMNSNSVG